MFPLPRRILETGVETPGYGAEPEPGTEYGNKADAVHQFGEGKGEDGDGRRGEPLERRFHPSAPGGMLDEAAA